MSENIKDPQDVREELEAVLTLSDKTTTFSVDDFITKLTDLKKKYVHKAYDRFDVVIAAKGNDSGLLLLGVRKENQQEVDARVEKDSVKKKNIDEHELKEYLRLRKKFDKKASE